MTIRSVLRLALVGLAALPLALHAGDAVAAKKQAKPKASAPAPARKKSIALGAFTGNKTKEVRGWVQSSLEGDFNVTDAEDFKPKNTDAAYEKMANDLGVDAVVVGKVEQQRVVLTIRGSDGAIIKELVVKAPRGPRLKRAIENGVPPAIGKAIGAPEEPEAEEEEEEEPAEEAPAATAPAEPAADAEEKTEAEGEAEEEPAEEEEAADPDALVAPAFVAELGVRFLNRKLTFNDTLTQLNPDVPLADDAFIMRDYELRLDPTIFVQVQVYPGAMFGGEGFIANLGIVGGFDQGIPIDSNYAGDLPDVPEKLKNNTQEWFVGPRVRVPSQSNEFGFEVTYGHHSFTLEGDEKFPIVPDTDYTYIRVGGDASFSFGRLYLGLDLGVRLVLSSGELETYWFENASGKGIDVGLNVGYELTKALSLVAGGNMTRYGFDFNPINKATAERVAGGAVDQYLSGFIGARFVLGGGSSSKGFGLASASVTVAPKDAPKEKTEEPEPEEEEEDEADDEEDAEE